MAFESKLQMEYIEGTEMYFLLSPLAYRTWKGILRIIPKDFISDGHSIPKLLRSVAGSPFASKTVKASWYHDWLIKTLVEQGIISRSEADSEYSHALSDEGWKDNFWDTFKRKRNYLGVRIGAGLKWITGWMPWNRRKKESDMEV